MEFKTFIGSEFVDDVVRDKFYSYGTTAQGHYKAQGTTSEVLDRVCDW